MCIDIPALLSVSLPRFQVGIGFPISSTKRRGCRLSSQRNASPAPLGNPVLRTLWVGCSEAPLGRSAPGAPPARRGSPFLPRNGEKEGRGQAPWTPFFYGPLVPTRSFRRLCHIVPVVGLLRYPSAYPDLERFFRVRLHSKDLGGGRFPIGYPAPLPSNGLARQGTPSGSGRQPVKNPKGPTNLSVQCPSPDRARLAEFPRPQAGKENGIMF